MREPIEPRPRRDRPDELFDVVNERDEVIARRPRSEVHRLGLMHRAVHVLVFNAAGQVFLQKRSMRKDRQPGLWDSSASGHLEAGEDYDAAARRELREEIGLELAAPPQRLFKLPASARTDQEHVWAYRCQAEGPFKFDPHEIERGAWFAPEQVTRWMAERPRDFADALLLIWEKQALILTKWGHPDKEQMIEDSKAKSKLLALLRAKSVFHGDFVLSSGAQSTHYIDCRLTTLDPEGAWLVGEVMHNLIQQEARALGRKIDAIGGLTMGADPIAVAVGMYSFRNKDTPPLRPFVVRKAPKGHGQGKLIEGNFKPGDTVVVLEDVVTRGDSALSAIEAVVKEGGAVAFVAVLVDRREGGREKIEAFGHRVVAAFERDDLIRPE